MIGKVIGHYRVLSRLGEGGMGVVYGAEDLTLKRRVALKVLPPHLVESPESKARFLIEAQAAAALSHPNICVIHEAGESAGQPYIAMEYVAGRTLRARLEEGPLEAGEAVRLALEVASGLEAAHGQGILHRDIKSANIMVTPEGWAKVMDFGLAKRVGGPSVTESHMVVGTAAYMSPEQARGEALDARTDIWSLGVVLYELVAGRLPFRGDHSQAVIYAILHTEAEPLTAVRPGTARELDQVVGQALAKAPAARYQTMGAFRADLAAVAEGLRPITAKARPAAVRLAVLPFANLTGDADQEYLSDGLTQEMITLLGRLHPQGLGVIARTSVMRYKQAEASIDQIGRELGVGYVLEGSVRREGSRVRVAADLIQVQDQVQLWGDAFEREMAGILALQNDVAREVAKALALTLLPAEQARLIIARPVNPEAYEAYLKAIQNWIKLTPEDLDTAERYCELALARSPDFAPAYAVQSMVWGSRQQIGLVPSSEAGPRARAAALKAIELDDTTADAHFALAGVLSWTDWDFVAAEPAWQRAVELGPGNALVLAGYSHYLMITGRPREALEPIERALKRDPFNVIVTSFYAVDLLLVRRYDEALEAARAALRIQPGAPVALNALWCACVMTSMPEGEVLDSAKRYLAACYDDGNLVRAIDEGVAAGGYAEGMRRAAEVLAARSEAGIALPTDVAYLCIEAGERAKALQWVEKAFEVRDPSMPYIGVWPAFDAIRDEPRFQELLRKMKLPTGDT